jgi:hypothetical protein
MHTHAHTQTHLQHQLLRLQCQAALVGCGTAVMRTLCQRHSLGPTFLGTLASALALALQGALCR